MKYSTLCSVMLYCRINEPFEWSCFWAGNGTVLPSRVGSTSRRGEFCFGCQQVLRLMNFSVFSFYFSPLLLIQKTKSSYQQGLSPPSQSPNSCSPDSPVQCEDKMLRASSWNFLLRTKWCWDLLPPVQSPWDTDPQSLSSPTLLLKQVHVLALEKHFSSVET